MAKITSKTSLQEKKEYPSNGNFINWFIQKQKVKKVAVAKSLGTSSSSFCHYLKQDSLQFDVLWKVSKAIDYNLVMDLGERLEIPFETQSEKKLKIALAEKVVELVALEMELKIYKEIKS